ncbi:hypothetical protein HanPI659440_Chr10g0398881 [Helianthus annuus]|nr:hypothetical protein HanPI659440_Chr10g0398881 [Helianthus annuus]
MATSRAVTRLCFRLQSLKFNPKSSRSSSFIQLSSSTRITSRFISSIETFNLNLTMLYLFNEINSVCK